jgi:hypothetical protein
MKNELGTLFKKAAREYKQRKRAAEAQVARWEWATNDDRSLEPLYFERNKFSRGKRLPGKPAVLREGCVAYGLDDRDRVIVERSYVPLGGRPAHYETFYTYSKQAIEWIRYDYTSDRKVLAVRRARLSGDRIDSIQACGQYGASTERYIYDNGNVVRIERDVHDFSHPIPDQQRWSDFYVITWDALGRVATIGQSAPGTSRVSTVFKRPAKGETLADILAVLEHRLVAHIRAAAVALRLKQPAYALVLAYDGEGNDMLPPSIGVGLARERDKWLSSVPDEGAWLLWNPAEFKHYARGPLQLEDKQLLSLCTKANQQIAMKDKWKAGRDLLDRVSARLRALPWNSLMPVTDDFVVYAVDYELGVLRRTLRTAAGKQQFARWVREKRVP